MSTLPLARFKILDLTRVRAGPTCVRQLSDWGAEVIKIEAPEGDAGLGGARHGPDFWNLHRNKRSLTLDLQKPEAKEIIRRLAAEADVVMENFRPGVMDRLGLGYARFAEEKPGLVYCSISAYGQSGPRAGEGGFDLTIQAASGVMSVTGEEGGAPVKCGVPVSDFASGLYAAFSIASLLAHVRNGGAGAHIDVPMFGCTLGIAKLVSAKTGASFFRVVLT